jgi:deazaflavin-dependent oxidoreductase (nitroreductase family)
MPSDLVLKAMNGVHRTVLAVTGNRVGARIGGMPSLELTTIGRQSRQRRSVMLTAPLTEGSAYIVVASRGGDDRHPAWYLNLCADPDVEVRVVGGPVQQMRARVADPGERARLWPIIAGRYANYAGYQKRTTREIPLVFLEPTGSSG